MAYLIVLLALAFALSPAFTSSFGGFAPDAFPVPQTDPPVQPAGYAFAIWGIIYLWLLAHAGFGAWARRAAPGWAATRAPLAVSLAVGAVWIPVANASPLWAAALILVMLAGAVAALLRAGRGDPWLLDTPLGLYAGWLTAAASVSVGLVLAGWGILGAVPAALVAIALAAVIGLPVLARRPSPGYALALIWALIAVVVQNAAGPWLVAGAAMAAIAAVAAVMLRRRAVATG
ncbi:hypothetical protein E2L08_12615 [Palleronia sediminis]|uniref:Seryl-tRNA synthetase n=1 Tax=Palleronia sediminis TaxID=2547833 RepID=A0A4R6A5L1_9RHOB|nr:tryptophan-rich sensory protein [Palleronia sediminis]TDL78135.1 hypothetical protein E2L08_12615 [Palleronia sediminis]